MTSRCADKNIQVPVYELKLPGNEHVMRRRSDDWINATHILKIVGFDKPARTRILEREVQKGVHEKIQGGYGKYQGTWIPLSEGRVLAEKNGIFDRISEIFTYVPGDRSPPPAPKHTTAGAGRTKTQKQAVPPPPPVSQPVVRQPVYAEASEVYPDPSHNQHYYEEDTRDHATPESQSFMHEDDFNPLSQNSTASRKRKRNDLAAMNEEVQKINMMYGDELLDYFITSGDDPEHSHAMPPIPPETFDVNSPIDTHGHTALHWACAMGDVQVARDLLLNRNAQPNIPASSSQETPLMRAVLFTNNYDKSTFPRIVQLLAGTIVERDRHGATVFHHIAQTLGSKSKWNCARYYCEVLINKMQEMGTNYVQTLLRSADSVGDTAVLIAVRHGCMKVASFLLNHCPEAGDQPNHNGDTANDYLRALKEKRESLEQPPSSPPLPFDRFPAISKHRRIAAPRKGTSRAASTVVANVEHAAQEASNKLAVLYETEIKEKDTTIAEAKKALSLCEASRHKIRQETFELTASNPEDEELRALREQFDNELAETRSLLEQKDHASLQNDVRQRDQLTNPQAFRSANPRALTNEEIRAALPWAMELNSQQIRRRHNITEIASLTAAAGVGERVGKNRKLVAIATGINEDQLDQMSAELLESIQAANSPINPHTPTLLSGITAG